MFRNALNLGLLLSAIFVALLNAGTAGLAADSTTIVKFKPGNDSASYQGVITGYDTARYILDARAGQRMNVILSASNPQAYFNLIPPGSSSALFDGSVSGSSYSGSLPKSGSYVIEIYLMRAAARRGETSRYSVSIAIPAGNSSTRPPDYADGNAGGPDNWVVSGIASNDRLNVRAAPSPAADIVGRLRNGVMVRNLGCQLVNGSRWCRISTRGDVAVHGWANGRYLVEGGNSGSVPDPNLGGQIRDTKCKVNSRDCIRKAEQKCNGSFRTIYSQSHAGGIVDDKVPGPIIWYYLEYQCGPSDGRPPRFPFRGASYEAGSTSSGASNAGTPAGQAVMRETCKNAAASSFGQRAKNILVLPVESTGDGYNVYGQYPERGSNVTTFTCKFKRDGSFRSVRLD